MEGNSMIVKVCGMTDGDNIRAVENIGKGIDMIGFIFYHRSPRCLVEVPSYLPSRAGRVGVFVDADEGFILNCVRTYGLDLVQLHGHESAAFCLRLHGMGLSLIKAFGIKTSEDLSRTSDFEGICDLFLFDTGGPLPGGSGTSFDWGILDAYKGSTPFLLSGGIGPGSEEALASFSHPAFAGIDLNSRFEISPGIKDPALISSFLSALRPAVPADGKHTDISGQQTNELSVWKTE